MLRLFISLLITLTLLTGCIFDDVNKEPTSQPLVLGDFSGTEDIEILASDILNSVSDPDDDTLTITDVVLAKGLGVLNNSDQSKWTYTPSLADLGEIIFNYTATDGTIETSSTITLNVVNSNRLSVFANSPVHIRVELNQEITTAKITLNALGDDHVISSSNGNATFVGLPANTEYYVIVEDTNGVFANEYYSNITPAANQTIIQTLPVSSLSTGVVTQLSVSDVTTGLAVTGLIPYINTTALAAEKGRLTSLTLPNLMATESAGTYSFLLANNETDYQINIDELIDSNNTEYSIFGTDTSTYASIINAGDTSSLDLASTSQLAEFTASYTILNAQSEALSVGRVLTIFNLSKNETESWSLEDGTTNKYSFTLTSENIRDKRVVQPIDVENDGFFDLQPALAQNNPLGLLTDLSPSHFDDDKKLNIDLTVVPVATTNAITSELITNSSEFKAGSNNEVLIAFDRPIELQSSVSLTSYGLSQLVSRIDLANPAGIYKQDKSTTATTDQSESTLNLNNANAYEYVNDSSNTIAVTLGGGADSITSSYVSEYTQSSSSISLSTSSYELVANGTLLRITPTSSLISSDTQYSFEFSVNDAISTNVDASIIYKVTATSNKAEQLSDFTLDNFDFKDTSKYDPLDANALLFLDNQAPHEDLFFELDASYDSGTDKALLKYVEYSTNDLSTLQDEIDALSISTSNNTLYLVTETPILGTVEIKSQSEVYDASGSTETTVVEISDALYQYVIDTPESGANPQQIQGKKLYLFDKPSNHGISTDVIKDTFNVDVAAGANISREGIYYVYELPITPTQSGQVTSVTLEFNISINGSQTAGTQTYQVK